jgi:hypothetical protein
MFDDIAGALHAARRRLEHLAADPVRNARHAIKVLLKYLLLDVERVPLDGVEALMASVPLTRAANERFLGMKTDALAEWAVASLVQAKAARIVDGALVNA